jgi:hypothetical protein
MHTKVWLLVNRNDTQRKNVFKTFKANKIDLIEYDQIIVPITIIGKLPIIVLYYSLRVKNFY